MPDSLTGPGRTILCEAAKPLTFACLFRAADGGARPAHPRRPDRLQGLRRGAVPGAGKTCRWPHSLLMREMKITRISSSAFDCSHVHLSCVPVCLSLSVPFGIISFAPEQAEKNDKLASTYNDIWKNGDPSSVDNVLAEDFEQV